MIKIIQKCLRIMGVDWKQGVMDAVAEDNIEKLNELLETAGKYHLDFMVRVSYKGDERLLSPLTRAAWMGNYTMAEILLRAGACVNFTDQDGTTPLIAAVEGGNPTICQLLLHHRAKVNARGSIWKFKNCTALEVAVQYGEHEIAAVLLQHGAKIYDPSKPWKKFNRSLLNVAIYKSCEMVELLLDCLHKRGSKVPLNFVLCSAICYRREECAILVLQRGYLQPNAESNTFAPFDMPNKYRASYFDMAANISEMPLLKLMSLLVEINPNHLQEEWLLQNRLQWEVRKHTHFATWLMEYRRQPPSLTKLCRSTILAHFGEYYRPKIDALPLPKLLKTFLATLESPYGHILPSITWSKFTWHF